MIESLTSSIAKAKASSAPAIRLAAIRGSVTLIIARSGGLPRFSAASSSVTLVCWKPAAADRTT